MLLQSYWQWRVMASSRCFSSLPAKRRTDNLLMMTTMDALYLSFGHVSPLAKLARNAGLMMVNKLPS